MSRSSRYPVRSATPLPTLSAAPSDAPEAWPRASTVPAWHVNAGRRSPATAEHEPRCGPVGKDDAIVTRLCAAVQGAPLAQVRSAALLQCATALPEADPSADVRPARRAP